MSDMKPPFLPSSSGSGPTPIVGPGPQGVDPEHTEGAAPGPKFAPEAMGTPNALGESTGAPASLNGFRPTSDGPHLPPLGPAGVDYPKPATAKTR